MPNDLLLSRRAAILSTGLALSAASLPRVVFALTDEEATSLIGKLVADLNAIINSGKPETAMYGDFENLLARYADVPIIARSSLGLPWRTASAGQRTRYVKAFSVYLSIKYGKRFREFIGGEIVVTGSKLIKSGYLVSSVAKLRGDAPFALEWQVSDKSGQDKMFNLYIEGISLLATERTEIAAMMDKRKGDLDQLIADLATIN